MTVFSPNRVGRVLTRKSMVRVGQDEAHAAVLRHALFRDVELGQHLDARNQFVADRQRRRGVVAQHAVHAHADPVELLEGLEVDVGGAQLHGVHQDLVQEAHDRRVLDLVGRFHRRGCLLFLGEFDLGLVAGQVAQSLLGAPGQRGEQGEQGVVGDDHRLDRGLALELDLVQGLRIGRVGNGHRQPVAALGQRHDALGRHQLGVDRRFRQRGDAEGGQVEQRIAEGLRAEGGEGGGVERALGDDGVDQGGAVAGGLFLQRVGLLRAQAPRLHQRASKTGQRRRGLRA
jgi:hypothetical protein